MLNWVRNYARLTSANLDLGSTFFDPGPTVTRFRSRKIGLCGLCGLCGSCGMCGKYEIAGSRSMRSGPSQGH